VTASSASFTVDVKAEDSLAFAAISGDWNPLHTNADHAARTAYRRPVLHGAFSAGLISRMAGMHLPGADCLLHSMRLRFVAPIILPASLRVDGSIVQESGGTGRVEVSVADAQSGRRYVDAAYEFSRHVVEPQPSGARERAAIATPTEIVLVTGATGGLGGAVVERLGRNAVGMTRQAHDTFIAPAGLEELRSWLSGRRIKSIVHCAWPAPDNERLTALGDVHGAVEHNVAGPLTHVITLAQALREFGAEGATLVLVGSSAALPGRHHYKAPLYTLAKSLVPVLSRVLAVEMADRGHRCIAVTFDVIEGGMNKGLSPGIRAMHADRVPSGRLPTVEEAANHVAWVLENPGSLASGGTIELTGSAIP
jgi:3-hydroxybutyryl-CoA dehydratase